MENLIERKPNKNKSDEDDVEEKKKRPVIKSATDLQRLKLEKLMRNPEKPIIIPEQPKEKDYMQTVPSFVRNVMGSSAGAGSGEFHVYRHLRRKEYARQKCIHAKSMREQLDEEYQSKLEKNRLDAEAKTAKKRSKRLKKKQRAKKPKTSQKIENVGEEKQDTTEDEENLQSQDEESSNKIENIVQTVDVSEKSVEHVEGDESNSMAAARSVQVSTTHSESNHKPEELTGGSVQVIKQDDAIESLDKIKTEEVITCETKGKIEEDLNRHSDDGTKINDVPNFKPEVDKLAV